MTTPCLQRDYRVGQAFIVTTTNHGFIAAGDLVVLDEDDGTSLPFFKVLRSRVTAPGDQVCIYIDQIQPYGDPAHMTPSQRRGYKVGDLFEVTTDNVFSLGAIVQLAHDDGTPEPKFRHVSGPCSGNDVAYEGLDYVTPISPNQQDSDTMTTNMTIETRTFVNGIDASSMSDEQIFQHIASIEAKIEELSAVKRKPKKLETEIERLTKVASDLADYVDAR